MTSCRKGIQEQEPGQEYFCGKADLRLAVASKERLVHVCESKSNSRLYQPRRGRTNPVAHSAMAWKVLEVKWEHFHSQRHSYHAVLGLLKASYPSAGHSQLDDSSFQKQYSSGHLQAEPCRIGRNWIMVQMNLGLDGDGATFFFVPSMMIRAIKGRFIWGFFSPSFPNRKCNTLGQFFSFQKEMPE